MKYATVDIPLMLTGVINEIDFTEVCGTSKVNFHFGDSDELDRYLQLFKTQSSEQLAQAIIDNGTYDLAVSNGDVTMPYPLIWMKQVKDGNPRIQRRDRKGVCQTVDNLELLFICDTDCEWLNTTRWSTNMTKLRQLQCFLEQELSRKQWVLLRDSSVSEIGDFAKDADCKVRWDAVIWRLDLLINAKCLELKEYQFCNN